MLLANNIKKLLSAPSTEEPHNGEKRSEPTPSIIYTAVTALFTKILTHLAFSTIPSRKFQHPYAGPFTILKSAGENAFVLDIPAHWRLHAVFNIARLKLAKVDKTPEHPPPPPLCSTTTVEYEVESICEHRGTTVRDLKYLVKWVGYTDPAWEPLANLRGSSNELLGEYHAANGLRVYRWMERE